MENMLEVVQNRIADKIGAGTVDAQVAISRMLQEGKMQNDFLAPLGVEKTGLPVMSFSANGTVKLHVTSEEFRLHQNAIFQLGDKLKIPTGYLQRLSTGTEWERMLAAHILNQHTIQTPSQRMLIRAVGDEVRGVLSDSYKRMDNVSIFTAFMNTAMKQGAAFAGGHMSDTRIYLEMIIPTPFEIATPKNGVVHIAFGVRLSSSDYGDGALDIRSFFLQGVCLNGAVRESLMRAVHFGSKLPETLQLSKKTYELDTKTQVSTVGDITKQVFNKDMLLKRIAEIERSASIDIDLSKELSELQKGGKLLKQEVDGIEKLLMANRLDDGIQGEATLWKLTQGISAFARDVEPIHARYLQELAGSYFK